MLPFFKLESIRWCVWSVRPSGPLRLPHLKCLLLLSWYVMDYTHARCLFVTNYQLPNGPVKAGRRWGQRHPQGANLGSNGILNFLSKLKQWLPPAHPKSLASQCMSGQPISTCHFDLLQMAPQKGLLPLSYHTTPSSHQTPPCAYEIHITDYKLAPQRGRPFRSQTRLHGHQAQYQTHQDNHHSQTRMYPPCTQPDLILAKSLW